MCVHQNSKMNVVDQCYGLHLMTLSTFFQGYEYKNTFKIEDV